LEKRAHGREDLIHIADRHLAQAQATDGTLCDVVLRMQLLRADVLEKTPRRS